MIGTASTNADTPPTLWQTYGIPVSGLLLPTFTAAVAIALIGALIARFAAKKSFAESLLFVSPFVWLGAIIGLVVGASQEAIVGGLVTGVLAAVTGLFSFMFAKDSVADFRPLLSVAIVLLCFSAVFGLALGRVHRQAWDNYDRDYANWKEAYERVSLPQAAVAARYDYCRKTVDPKDGKQCDALLVK